MKKHTVRMLAALSAAALVLAACGSAPEESTGSNAASSSSPSDNGGSSAGTASNDNESDNTGSATNEGGSSESSTPESSTEGSSGTESSEGSGAGEDEKVCMVTDTGGIDDRSFNAAAWKGVQDAESDLGIEGKYLSSSAESDYVPNINQFVQQNCSLIVTVGFLMGDQTQKAAEDNPDQKFAIVDFQYDPAIDNVLGLIYNTAQAGFLGGYLAAGLTETGKVATYGGQKLPTVTIYMDGYWEGVQYYNQQNDTDVKVLGWNEDTQDGTFTGDFTDQSKGLQVTKQFESQGADIVFPVAGNVGLGSAKAAEQSDGKLKLLWVDSPGCVSAEKYCDVLWGSVVKGISASVEKAAKEVQDGNFAGGNYIGTLDNGGTKLILGEKLGDKIPQDLKDQLKQVKQGIISGDIEITSPAQPQS